VEPDGRKAYVANSRSRSVSIVSVQTGDVLATVSVEPNPQRFGVLSSSREVIVNSYDSPFLTAISITSNRVTRRLNADRWISDIKVDPRLNRFYLVQERSNRLLYYEPSNQLTLQSIPIESMPFRVALDPDMRTLFVTSRNANTVTLVDRITGVVEKVLEVGRRPYDVVVVELP
jgi:YVTN family beta-propeller protein